MDLKTILNRLWKDYSEQNPSADKISGLFREKGESIVNDHIAFRTLEFTLIRYSRAQILSKNLKTNPWQSQNPVN